MRVWQDCRYVMFAGEPMFQLLQRFARDDSAATAIEYGLIAAALALVIISAVDSVGTKLKTTFSSVASAV
jgi:pilus assembly protein Flp/PilA